MPRLTNTEYLNRRALIQAVYGSTTPVQALLGRLDIDKQQVLHYYATGKYNLSDKELIAHRKWRDQSTSLKSGKAYAELYRVITKNMDMLNIKYSPNDTLFIVKKISMLNKRMRKFKTIYAKSSKARLNRMLEYYQLRELRLI